MAILWFDFFMFTSFGSHSNHFLMKRNLNICIIYQEAWYLKIMEYNQCAKSCSTFFSWYTTGTVASLCTKLINFKLKILIDDGMTWQIRPELSHTLMCLMAWVPFSSSFHTCFFSTHILVNGRNAKFYYETKFQILLTKYLGHNLRGAPLRYTLMYL